MCIFTWSRRRFAGLILVAVFGFAGTDAAEVAAANKYLVLLKNGVGPGANPNTIQATVRSGNQSWSGPILYHQGVSFESPFAVYEVTAKWNDKFIPGTFVVSKPGRVLEISVEKAPGGNIRFVWSQK